MSDTSLARRAAVEVAFDGVNITKSIAPYLLSLTYTDSEEGEADDLQLKLQDRDGIWQEKWLGQMIDAAASGGGTSSTQEPSASPQTSRYKVSAKSGLNVRSGPGTSYSRYGALSYGTEVEVHGSSGNWAQISYSGKTAYVCADYLTAMSSGSGWQIGDAVVVTGKPQYTSYGTKPGAKVTDYKGTITHLNLKDGVPYPIHVGSLGWFALNEVKKVDASGETAEPVTSTGLKIQAVIATRNWDGTGGDAILDCGQFELDSVDCSGPPSVIVIRSTALPYTAQIRQTKKSKAWEAYKLSGIAREMAEKAGMACLFLAQSDPEYSRVEQYQESDIRFLSRLCQGAGLSLKSTNNILVIFDQQSYESKSPAVKIRRGDGTYTKFKLKAGEADTHYASCRVRWTTSTGKLIEGIAKAEDYKEDAKGNQQLEVRAKVSSIAEAESLAAKKLRLHNKYHKTASFTMPGNPTIGAGMTVELTGWGAWDGTYIVSQAKHTVGGSYTTQIELRKTLEGY